MSHTTLVLTASDPRMTPQVPSSPTHLSPRNHPCTTIPRSTHTTTINQSQLQPPPNQLQITTTTQPITNYNHHPTKHKLQPPPNQSQITTTTQPITNYNHPPHSSLSDASQQGRPPGVGGERGGPCRRHPAKVPGPVVCAPGQTHESRAVERTP